MALTNITYDSVYFNSGGAIGGYDNYRWNSYLNEDSSVLANKFVQKALTLSVDLSGKKVLVVGCAYGFLVQYLISLGVDAYGMDISSYAVSQSPVPDKLIVGDVRLDADWKRAKTLAGLTGNQKFDMVIDEDMICCLTDSEASSFCTYARKYGSILVHLIDLSTTLVNWYNFHTISEWKAIAGMADKWYSRFNWLET
jgi:2-polyprenyl-3-methyl-5-hydroxy-6-metoxy-1,4-benzoquinol methylase